MCGFEQAPLQLTRCLAPCMQVYMLSSRDVLDEARLLSILDSGHSRIPVHRPNNRWRDGLPGAADAYRVPEPQS